MTSLILPIVLSTVALFFASFLAWMVIPLHRKDWVKLEREDDLIATVRDLGASPGNYMFPGCETPADMKSEEYNKKWETGPCGTITVFPKVSMGKNLVLTFLFFLSCNICLAYLATLGLDEGASFRQVFRFVSTAGLLTFLAAIVQHAIWFHNRIIGHIIESIGYAIITGVIFGALWP